ncbi:MAG: hypothetical protein ACFUZC_22785 [Chthoniobacteraceae bacterium]
MLVKLGHYIGLWNTLGVRRRQISEAHFNEIGVAVPVVIADESNLDKHPVGRENFSNLAFDAIHSVRKTPKSLCGVKANFASFKRQGRSVKLGDQHIL